MQDAKQDAEANADLKRLLLGAGLLVMAWICGEARDFVPSLAAKSVKVTAEVSTLSEPDDARVFRAFSSVREGPREESGLEPLPKQSRDIRKTQLWVTAPSGAEARARRDRISEGMRQAFVAEGKGEIQIHPRYRADPVPNETTVLLGRLMRWGAGLFALGGLGLMVVSGLRLRTAMAPSLKVDPVVEAAVVYILVLVFAAMTPRGMTLPFLPPPLNLVSSWVLLMLVMAIPFLVSFVIVHKMVEVKQAAHWIQGSARITASRLKAGHVHHAGGVSGVVNEAVVAYEFSAGGKVRHGSRISIGETAGEEVAKALKKYPVGASVPVYYDPANPDHCVLEREAPANAGCMAGIILTLFAGGLALASVFLFPEGFLGLVTPWFPKGANPLPALFFGLGGLVMALAQWGAWRQAAAAAQWPQATGRIVRSETESYLSQTGRSGGGGARLYEPVIEYAYTVDGGEYHSTQVRFGGRLATGARGGADKAVARYPVGSPVQVLYDPANPANAVLEAKAALTVPGLVLMAVFFGLAAYFGGAFGAR